ncbi:MAG: hypothetical protein HDT39_15170 [Lachnospiraceae bacterium]|nr:hypothetical protein [Lachnospiraceae bacterium]
MGKFYYKQPCFEYNSDGKMEIIHKYCVGPIEVLIYGITRDKEFYFDWTFPEFYPDDSELERDYRIISKERMIRAINVEIETCEKKGDIELVKKYKAAIEMIENNKY